DRKSTRLNSSHVSISYAVFCLKKKNGHLGVLYEVGRGVPDDWKQAVKLYLQGVDNNDPICMYYYARAIEKHRAEITKIFKRLDKAETYYKQAAAASVTPAKDWCVEHNVKFQ